MLNLAYNDNNLLAYNTFANTFDDILTSNCDFNDQNELYMSNMYTNLVDDVDFQNEQNADNNLSEYNI